MTAPETRTFPPGVTCWIDLEVPDLEAAATFYKQLLGWEVQGGDYRIATLDGADAAGITRGESGRWSTYVCVDDADAAIRHVTGLGASVVTPVADVVPGARTSRILDPDGHEIRLWQATGRAGAQVANLPGAWNFSNLRAGDPGAAQRFYGPAFGWRFVDQGWATTIQVPGYGDHLEATIDPDIHTRQKDAPEGFEDVVGAIVPAGDDDPGWYVVLTVADRDAVAAEAERLGGTVIATLETDWTAEAVVRDPQGAVFTASQFTPPTDWG